ncbi:MULTISPECIES: pilus (MSHA type) biogenesis protein MshL [Marinobacter]|jgi:MSHA biogenesis protein MshL|uniref:pilus (MSHA type) biogenesis protein MshL n=1 Tax=Marinobacter TaxID=2742 RepID=UPI000FCA99E2|nr:MULTISPECIES: pilus (MSHA type) biogenesis protein MshL [Marinobacter]MCZ4286971.1 pilus (MSHA type) biogenesis protein MshL [Marinobacter salarius]MDM8181043.1 pilus (MSHA type) biogenesis protein MshL [Marinobacter salarius]RUT76651.1 pilus (MSHA type) biogenesis protein MshL [Marinobacter sp. NP-6]VVT29052.1 Type II secretion system protein D [Marinobacter salarius]VXB24802.1 MSHA biogenesis protein MshL [Marinobacter salarius]
MTDKRAAMTLNRTFLTVLLATSLAACSNNPLMRTSQATSTDAAQSIDDALAEAEAKSAWQRAEREQAARAGVPEEVSAALMPSLSADTNDEERFDVDARGLAAGPFFEALVEGSRYNVVVHPGVDAVVDLRLRDVTVPEVMDIASDLYGLDMQRNGRLFQVKAESVQTRMFPIDYLHFKRSGGSETRVSSGQVSSSRDNSTGAGASQDNSDNTSTANLVGTRISTETESDFWTDIQRALQMIVGSENGNQVIINPGAGLVMVRSDGKSLAQVEEYLRRTQLIMQRQVVLEAKILEIGLNEGYQQGVNWSDIQSASSVTASDGLPAEFTAQSLAGQAIRTSDIGGLFSATFREGTFTALIELLGEQGNVQILSSPRISTINNQKAVIKVGTDEFFVTDIDFDDNNSAVTATDRTSTSVELTPFFSGISLDVTPQISEDGAITLHVHPSVSEVNDQEKVITVGDRDVTLPLALSTVRETDSVIRAESGQIVVIGGLIQNTSEDNNSAVPFFSEIPLLGELFKQRRFQSRKSELVILLRPVVAGSQQMNADVSASRDRMRVLRELLESSESVKPQPEKARR